MTRKLTQSDHWRDRAHQSHHYSHQDQVVISELRRTRFEGSNSKPPSSGLILQPFCYQKTMNKMKYIHSSWIVLLCALCGICLSLSSGEDISWLTSSPTSFHKAGSRWGQWWTEPPELTRKDLKERKWEKYWTSSTERLFPSGAEITSIWKKPFSLGIFKSGFLQKATVVRVDWDRMKQNKATGLLIADCMALILDQSFSTLYVSFPVVDQKRGTKCPSFDKLVCKYSVYVNHR